MREMDVKKNIQLAREKKLDKVRAATAKRNAIKGYLAAQHGVNIRRVVLMDRAEKFIGKAFNGAYVIKNRHGRNLKFNF